MSTRGVQVTLPAEADFCYRRRLCLWTATTHSGSFHREQALLLHPMGPPQAAAKERNKGTVRREAENLTCVSVPATRTGIS